MEKEKFKQYINDFIKLLSLYLNKKEDPDFCIDKEELSFFLQLSKFHSLSAILYLAIKTVKVNVEEDILNKLEQQYLLNIRKASAFEQERKELYKYLNEEDIDYLPLKGIVISKYYLDPYSREFADNDILFNKGDEKIKEFFIKRGYTVEYYRKSNHDVYLKKPFYNFEMHRSLFGETGDNKKVVEYFKNYLDKAPILKDKEHYLTNEDFYIYFTAHTYKHFHVSGCGIRTLIDYYLFLKNNTLDFAYINQEMAKIDLLDFSNRISSLSSKLFSEQKLDENEEEMLLFIASSGTYGTLENSVAKGVKEKGKFGYFMQRVFPPYSFYKTAYPWAYKTVILIPVAWLCRFFRVLFKNPKRAKRELKMISKQKKEDNEAK